MRTAKYLLDDRSLMLHKPGARFGETGIHADGNNLTVVFLSMNRTSLSIRLIESFKTFVPHFAGRFLIVDNGSEATELAILKAYLANDCPFANDILELGKNYGVAGGRNRGFREVKTDWILSLDNDIYLINNPFPQINRDLVTTGCHFLSVPLLNPDHETLYSIGGNIDPLMIEGGYPFLGIRCAVLPGSSIKSIADFSPEGEAFLCTFLFGGAGIFNRRTHDLVGDLDEGMQVGFEDMEFSLRLYQAGLKVGGSCVTSFVHDHPKAEGTADQLYERERYSRQRLFESARHFERKHGIRVWSEGVDQWLRAREGDQGIASPDEVRGQAAASAKRPRIALIVDSPDWAFANIARQVSARLSDEFEFEVISTWSLAEIDRAHAVDAGQSGRQPLDSRDSFPRILLRSDEFDLMHVFWRSSLTILTEARSNDLAGYAARLGFELQEFRSRFVDQAKLTTSVYDHLYLDGEISSQLAAVFRNVVVDYTVSSEKLNGIYRAHSTFVAPGAVIQDGVDLGLFHPRNLERFDLAHDRELVVGWVGNSGWGGNDSKGVKTILEPAIAELQARGIAIRGEFSDRMIRHVPQSEMIDYYSGIDVLVCASKIEGTPNPVLEAMACGVPVVSTDVGIVPEVLGPLQSQFILPARSVDCMVDALQVLATDRGVLRKLSSENLTRIAEWTWDKQAEKFRAFFRDALAPDQAERPRARAGELA